jgi:uncharacterized protein (UPF0333 family)
MGRLFSRVFGWIYNKIIIFLFVLTLLVGLNWIKSEVQRYVIEKDSRDELINVISESKNQLEVLSKNASGSIEKELDIINRTIQSKISERITKELAVRRLEEGPFGFTSDIPGTSAFQIKIKLKSEIKILEAALNTYYARKRSVKFGDDAKMLALSKAIDFNEKYLSKLEENIKNHPVTKIIQFIQAQIPVALGIVIGIIIVPVGIKILFFYIIAPLVEKCPSNQLLPYSTGNINAFNTKGAKCKRGHISSVSLDLVLNNDEHLAIRPDYIQGLARHSRKNTQWFINRSLPFSSISTGLVALTRVTSTNAPVVVSPLNHPLMEVGVVELSEGSAMVCHPRSLAGIIHHKNYQINITKHWRLFHLQSWLTLQLRFLIIHGPCKLIISGSRGVRIEMAIDERTINQSATLGFSANLNYSNSRCETFMSYWTGKEDLFNDSFQGKTGVVIYEEMPSLKRKASIFGRGLEGFVDTVLKIFGL